MNRPYRSVADSDLGVLFRARLGDLSYLRQIADELPARLARAGSSGRANEVSELLAEVVARIDFLDPQVAHDVQGALTSRSFSAQTSGERDLLIIERQDDPDALADILEVLKKRSDTLSLRLAREVRACLHGLFHEWEQQKDTSLRLQPQTSERLPAVPRTACSVRQHLG